MAFTPIPKGEQNWDVPVNAAFTDQDQRITDADDVNSQQWFEITQNRTNIANAANLGGAGGRETTIKAMNYAPWLTNVSTTIPNGIVHMCRLDLYSAQTINSIILPVFVAGSGFVAGQNFAGLYDSAGNRVAVTADQSGVWNSIGTKTMALTAPYAAPEGPLYVAWVVNATGAPAFLRSLSASALSDFINYGTTATTARWSTTLTGQTSLPASINMSARTQTGVAFWAGVI